MQVQKITLPMPGKVDQTAMAKRYAEAEALRRKFGGCKTMAELAKEAADARFEDMKFIKPSSIPEPTRSLLLSAKDGDMLPPHHRGGGIELYAVCGRRPSRPTRRSASKAQEELAQKEFEIVAKRHLRDLRQDAHIEYQLSAHDRLASRLQRPADPARAAADRRDDGRSGRDRARHHADELARALAPAACRRSCSTATPRCCSERARALGLDVPIAAIADLERGAQLLCRCPAGRGRCRSAGGGAGGDAAIVAAIEAGDRGRGGRRGAGAGHQPDRQELARAGPARPIPATPSSWPSWRRATAPAADRARS